MKIIDHNSYEKTVENLRDLALEILNDKNMIPWTVDSEIDLWDARFTLRYGEHKYLASYNPSDSLLFFINQIMSVYLALMRETNVK